MAEAVVATAIVSALVKEVMGRLTSLATEEFGLLWGTKDHILSLKDDFDYIEAFLADEQQKQVKTNVRELQLKHLRSVSLKVDNMLDEISTEPLLQHLYKQRGLEYKVRAFFSIHHNKFTFRVRIAHKVKGLREKVNDIAMAYKKFGFEINPSGVISHVGHIGVAGRIPLPDRETISKIKSSVIPESRNKEVKKISEKICDKDIGKSGNDGDQIRVYGIWGGKKFLVVLDDVCIEDNEKPEWDILSDALSCGAEGSIVLMTTRSRRTSRIMAKVSELQHELGFLSKHHSWLLFEKLAFAPERESQDVDISELEPIGREIVEKCERLPLAIETLGSLMWLKKTRKDWEVVRDSTIWNVHENKVLPSLQLSYDNLLPYLKNCFAYCCLFPKGLDIEKNLVIQLWVVNGFIPPREQMDLYVLGEEIFNCLVWRSFFQVVKKNKYKMHDLMHEMARYVMGHDCLVIDHAGTKIEMPDEVLHLSSSCPDFLFSSQDLGKLRSLRSILMWKGINNESCISQILNHMYLRVLYLPGLRTLPKSVCKLKHLRYLNLSFSKLEVLPESIINLQNLQVMILRESSRLRNLPDGLRYMKNLQYLDIEHCFMIRPYGLIKELTSLRLKLSVFHVGKEIGEAKIGELGNPNFLIEELRISRLENVEGLSDAKSANLKCKKNLKLHEDVLEGLEPHPSLLKELSISNYKGNIISSSWMVNLSNLVKVTFLNCDKCEHISSFGRLPKLRRITLEHMSSLKCLHNDDTNNMFPSLEDLHIDGSFDLVTLPCNLPKLKFLTLRYCTDLVSLKENMLPSLLELRIEWCEKLASLPGKLPKLESLRVESCDSLVSLQGDMFTSFLNLEKLRIEWCDGLVSLPCHLPKLKILKLRECHKLVSVPDEIQSDLDVLVIESCKYLNSRSDI
ncbi:hypothetical protein SSX86_030289 [Deinandra increscens subsp. villosa]|uniref:Uncharacterized protein n=1 Tax=Deinandra increscens subsp. villosa TaxID=3103831 RepID=A0AAP0CBU6_9ASTR